MADMTFLLVAASFFGLCVLYVRACDRLVGPADDDAAATADGEVRP